MKENRKTASEHQEAAEGWLVRADFIEGITTADTHAALMAIAHALCAANLIEQERS